MAQISFHPATKERQQAAKAVVDDTNARVRALEPTIGNTAADIEALKLQFAGSRICRVTVNLNPAGGDYEVPTDPTELADILDGAQIVLEEQGVATPYRHNLTALEGVSWAQTLYVTDASLYAFSRVSCILGKSATCAYAVVSTNFKLTVNGDVTINLYTKRVSASADEVFEIARIQPYSSTSSGTITIGSATYADDGRSFIGVRITGGNGTRWRTGGYAFNSSTQWIDESLVKVPIYDVESAGATPVERLISDGGDAENALDIMQSLACLKNIRMADVTLTHGATSITGNKFVVFDQVWVKTTRENVPMHTFDANGNITGTVYVDCICKWFCDVQADADYHLSPLHVQYRRNGDNSITEVPLDIGLVARYYSNTQNVTIDGMATAIMTTRADNSREVGASRSSFLARARNNNKMSVSVAIDGEESPRTFVANADARLFSMAGLAEDSFIGMFAYLFFGANVQASLPGINTGAVGSTSNGATDYILAAGVWNGAKNTASNQNSIVFLGIEDANWSSTGCMLPDITAISARIVETDESAEILTNTTESYFIYALDRLDYLPGDSNANYNLTTNDPATGQQITSPAWFLGHGYRRADFPKNTASGAMRRIGWDDSQLIRDALIFTTRTSDENINMAGCDYCWGVGYPSAPGTLPASATVELYHWLMVARGNNRGNGSNLGIASLAAHNALSHSGGAYWRSRPSLQLSPA